MHRTRTRAEATSRDDDERRTGRHLSRRARAAASRSRKKLRRAMRANAAVDIGTSVKSSRRRATSLSPQRPTHYSLIVEDSQGARDRPIPPARVSLARRPRVGRLAARSSASAVLFRIGTGIRVSSRRAGRRRRHPSPRRRDPAPFRRAVGARHVRLTHSAALRRPAPPMGLSRAPMPARRRPENSPETNPERLHRHRR